MGDGHAPGQSEREDVLGAEREMFRPAVFGAAYRLSVSSAMLLIMEELSPPERVAFVLHDVFGLEFGRIAEVLDVSVPGARQLASRARRRVAKGKQSTPQAHLLRGHGADHRRPDHRLPQGHQPGQTFSPLSCHTPRA
ncbi:sigma factor-like helix-turn-helix DNA-binding protein [Streptomyces milbemycinicus]|uniref:sigma factor-like helix-turn-helix DNA-binding protein n=1 Tax=Streptomyces milbemycinicus TaxID=476552 RepID=UPI00340A5A9C